MAPKSITKQRLKKILLFQIEKYNELVEKFPNFQMDIIEIMVKDHTYAQFGFDKEAILAAIKKHQVKEEESFIIIFKKINDYLKNKCMNL